MSPSPANGFDAVLPDDITTELALWKQLTFMAPNDRPKVPPLPELPPETYTHLVQALISLQSSAYPHSQPPTSSYPAPPTYNHPWPRDNAHIAGPSSIPLPPYLPPQTASSSQLVPSPAAASATASTTQDPEGTDDAISTAEDKRRRNTAASARFRVKKKLRTLNLEHTVSDLTGRTEELEREATDLRRENTWLKEIVVLKSRNLASLTLGPQAPASGNLDDQDEGDDGTEETESAVKRGGKGKERET